MQTMCCKEYFTCIINSWRLIKSYRLSLLWSKTRDARHHLIPPIPPTQNTKIVRTQAAYANAAHIYLVPCAVMSGLYQDDVIVDVIV